MSRIPRTHIALRVPDALLARLRAIEEEVMPKGVPHTDTDLYLLALTRGVERLEERLSARRATAPKPAAPVADENDVWDPPARSGTVVG